MPFKRLNITSQLVSTNTSVSTSNVTGALLLSGGAGIRGNVYADNIVLSGNLSVRSIISTGTITATTSNTLTIGTGLSGTSFDGSAPVTIAINSSVVTLTGSQNLTNKIVSGLSNTSTINDGTSSAYAIGYKAIPPSSTSSGNLALTDAGKHVYVSAGVTVPPNSTAPFDIGTVITIVNSSGSSITVTQGSGVTLRLSGSSSTGNRALAAYGLCSCIKVATDTWYISGSGMT